MGDFSDIDRMDQIAQAQQQRIAALEAEVGRLKAAAQNLLVADGHLNIWCMATHGHIPHGWQGYMAALQDLRDALDALGVPAETERGER